MSYRRRRYDHSRYSKEPQTIPAENGQQIKLRVTAYSRNLFHIVTDRRGTDYWEKFGQGAFDELNDLPWQTQVSRGYRNGRDRVRQFSDRPLPHWDQGSGEYNPDTVRFTVRRLNTKDGALLLLIVEELQYGDPPPGHIPGIDVVLLSESQGGSKSLAREGNASPLRPRLTAAAAAGVSPAGTVCAAGAIRRHYCFCLFCVDHALNVRHCAVLRKPCTAWYGNDCICRRWYTASDASLRLIAAKVAIKIPGIPASACRTMARNVAP